jgi:ABC-type sugar transport system substrate-binding protein
MIFVDAPFYIQNLRDQIAKTVFARDHPGIDIVAEEGFSRPDEVEGIVRAMVAAHPEIRGIYASYRMRLRECWPHCGRRIGRISR